MKLTTWNCARGFDKKKALIFSTHPDIAVIQECSKKSTLSPCNGYEALWADGDPNMGVAVFYKKPWHLRRIGKATTGLQWIVPFEVTGPQNFTLIAVWACAVEGNKPASYVGQIRRALREHPEWFRKGPVVMMGDFNSNALFDEGRRDWNHSSMVDELRQYGLESVYHALKKQEHGEEKTPTFYLLKDKHRRFHFDYIFAPQTWLRKMSLNVGAFTKWRPFSDHCPVTVEITPTA